MRLIGGRANRVVWAAWIVLALGMILLGIQGRFGDALVAGLCLSLTIPPLVAPELFRIKLPDSFISAITVFAVLTLGLGEIGDFYERFFAWDIGLHFASAVALSLIGSILIVAVMPSGRLRRSAHFAVLFAFAVGVLGGTLWELFEFSLDQFFAMNTQKGFLNTMIDLVANASGAALGAWASHGYFARGSQSGLSGLIHAFVALNPRLFAAGTGSDLTPPRKP